MTDTEHPSSDQPTEQPAAEAPAAEAPAPPAEAPAPPPPAAPPPPVAAAPPPQPPPATPPGVPVPVPLAKNPGLAGLLAALPGLGHVYCGLYLRGCAFFLLFITVISIVERPGGSGALGVLIPFIWLFNIIDAYRQANLINHGMASDLGMPDKARLQSGQGGIIAGIALVLLGTLELLERFDWWDWDYLWDAWPVVLIVAGAWLIVAAVRERSNAANDEI